MKVRLTVRTPAGAVERLLDREGVYLVGRHKSAHLLLQDPLVSSHHCYIELLPGRCRLRDLNSKNGTSVNGMPARERTLSDGDRITLGGVILDVRLERDPGSLSPVACRACRRAVPPEDRVGTPGEAVCRDCQNRTGETVVQFGPYYLFEKLAHVDHGDGRATFVYAARRLQSDEPLVVKLVGMPAMDEKTTKEVLREVSIWSGLRHPNIVRFHEAGMHDGMLYLAMERVDGPDLWNHVSERGRPLSPEEALDLLRPIVAAAAHLHGRGIVHRDIKPQNVFLHREAGRTVPKLGDFELAKIAATAGISLITTHELKGTPGFMPPEQWRDCRFVGPPGDVYSLGVTFYWALTLVPAHGMPEGDFDLWGEIQRRTLEEEPVDLHVASPDVPPALSDVVMRCLRKRPEDRPADARALLEALEAVRP
jgi:serine/threonine-protein kinase